MDDPFHEQDEIDIHPTVMKNSREILHYMMKHAYPSIIPQVSHVLLSYPFETSRFADLVLMVMENKQLFDDIHYYKLSYMVMKYFTEFDLDSSTGDYVLAPFFSIGYDVYEILEKHPIESPLVHRKLDPHNLGRRIIFQLCREYMVEEGFLEDKTTGFQIYLYQKAPDGAFMKLHFQKSEPLVTEEKVDQLLDLSNQFFAEYTTEGHYKGYMDR